MATPNALISILPYIVGATQLSRHFSSTLKVSVRDHIPPFIARSMWYLETIYLFTRSDYKTIFFPVVSL